MAWGTSGTANSSSDEIAKNSRKANQLLCEISSLTKKTNTLLETGSEEPSVARLVKVVNTGSWTSPAGLKAFTLTIEEGSVSVNDGTTTTTISLVPVSFSWDAASISNQIVITGLAAGTIFYINYLF